MIYVTQSHIEDSRASAQGRSCIGCPIQRSLRGFMGRAWYVGKHTCSDDDKTRYELPEHVQEFIRKWDENPNQHFELISFELTKQLPA